MANPKNSRRRAKASSGSVKISDTPETNPTSAKIHSFSRTIAEEHGEKAAVILQYLAHHVAKSKHVHGGKKWFYKTLDDLAVVFPYLKRSTIHATLQKLGQEDGPLIIGDYNKKGYDRTNWFAFRDDNFRKQAQSSKPVYFQVEDAVNYGIVAAVLLGNLVYWIRENRKTDQTYSWHSMSLGELSKHLPFDKATMHRAFKTLVDAKVIKSRETESKRGVIEYALIDETRLTEAVASVSNLDMGAGSKEGPTVSKLDETISKLDMTVSKPDLTVSNLDMTVSNLDNNTILIENLLKEPCLKDPGYVDADLPTTISNSLGPDKLKGVKAGHSFCSIPGSAPHTPNPMSSKDPGSLQLPKAAELLQLPGSSQLSVSQKSAKSQESHTSPKSQVSSGQVQVVTSPASPPTSQHPFASPLLVSTEGVATSSPSAPTSQPASPGRRPKKTRVTLDNSLEAAFSKYSETLQTMIPVTAKSAVTLAFDWITVLFEDTTAEQLAEFLKIRDQTLLYDKLAEFVAPHVEKRLERFMDTPERTLLAQFSSQLMMQFLTQAFCGAYDDNYAPRNAANSYKVSIMLRQKLRAYWEALEKRQQEKLKVEQAAILKKRAEQYASPDVRKEIRADISPAEKVQVLRNSLASRNNIGGFDEKGKLHHQVVDYNNRTFDAAYEFFKANPDFTVADLNKVLGKCLELPKERDYREQGNDSLWHARKGKDVSFLLEHLDVIVGSLGCVDEIGSFQPVAAEKLFKKSSNREKM